MQKAVATCITAPLTKFPHAVTCAIT